MMDIYNGNEPYIFISYAHRDNDRVLPLIEALQQRGYRVWYDAGIAAGTEWPEYIADRLDGSACVVAFIASSVLKLGKSAIKDGFTLCLFLAVLTLAVFFDLSPVLLVLGAGLAGYMARRLQGLRKGAEE